MKKILSFFLLCIFIWSSPLASADFFSEEIVGADPETAMIQEITLSTVNLKDNKEIKRYNSTVYFLRTIKTEAVKRFNDGSIPLYRRYDIITTLDSFVYTMNQYFLYEQRYEQSKKNVFKESARSYLEDSK